jgi:hypothetical protein
MTRPVQGTRLVAFRRSVILLEKVFVGYAETESDITSTR